MSTQAQIEANRRNAQRSTGPRTDAGKATVSRNAITHGLRSTVALISGEDPADYDTFADPFRQEFAAQAATDSYLVNRFIQTAWKLNRLPGLEAQAMDDYLHRLQDHHARLHANSPDAPAFSVDPAQFLLSFFKEEKSSPLLILNRYDVSLTRQFNRFLIQLGWKSKRQDAQPPHAAAPPDSRGQFKPNPVPPSSESSELSPSTAPLISCSTVSRDSVLPALSSREEARR